VLSPHTSHPLPSSLKFLFLIYGILTESYECCWLAVVISHIQGHLFQSDSRGPLFVSGAWNRRIKWNGTSKPDLDANMTCNNDITQVISIEFHFTVQRAVFFRENKQNMSCTKGWRAVPRGIMYTNGEKIFFNKIISEFARYTSFCFIKYIMFTFLASIIIFWTLEIPNIGVEVCCSELRSHFLCQPEHGVTCVGNFVEQKRLAEIPTGLWIRGLCWK
jgi:hypothetical protein